MQMRERGLTSKFLLCGLGFLLAAAAGVVKAQDSAPDSLVKGITQEVISAIKQDKDIQTGNSKKVTDLVEAKILPHFNFGRMTQLAMAVNWRKASPDQQRVLTQEFRALLVRTYSSALSSYRDQIIDYKPLRAKAEDTEVTVRSEVRQKGAQPVSIDYELEKTPAGWKVFDVKVGGVSLITTYKDDFANQVRESGVDGLIKTLASKNRQSDSRNKTDKT
jgi:phospholipid transport system substrate-binding protein